MSAAATELFEIPSFANDNSACLKAEPKSTEFQFERPDWVLFRSVGTLSQKAGVPARLLQRLVLKELVDNALDAGGNASINMSGDTYIIKDDGPGIGGSAEDIARMFSINRPMVSSKLWRLPKRGALGNGLRVVAGAVLASRGTLVVTTRNMAHTLAPRDDGGTSVTSQDADHPVGTAVYISFGDALSDDWQAMSWAQAAIRMAAGETYIGKTSPFWYDADQFFELLQAGGDRPVRELVAQLDGCTGAKAGQIADAFRGLPCNSLDRDQAVALLGAARSHAKPVSARRLGSLGKPAFLPEWYAIETGQVEIGSRNPKAEIPFVVEAWCAFQGAKEDSVNISAFVNRTPIAGDGVRGYRDKKVVSIHGCGLGHQFEAERGQYDITFSVIAPYIPITTDGKEPDLAPFVKEIAAAITAAVKRAKRSAPKAQARRSQKDIILSVLADAIAKVSDNGKYRFNCRQLFYAVRPYIISELDTDPTYGNFTSILTSYEDEHGLIADMYRDARGTLYHPHTGQDVSIGTLSVENYERPAWTFNKVLFIEKEGFFEALKAAKWPERYDCALLTSKGYSTRAVRDFLDNLADDADEDITVFCAHDADAFGTMIFQTLQEETRARPRRKVEIVNIGLEPWEAMAMGLDPENRDKDAKDAAVADYVKAKPDGAYWAEWLQRQRFELNAMTMPQFIAWLDGKMIEHGVAKVIPPASVVRDTVRSDAEFNTRTMLTQRILEAADFEGQVVNIMENLSFPSDEIIDEQLPQYLRDNPVEHWTTWAAQTAAAAA